MTDGLFARTWSDFRFHWRPSLGFHLVMQLLGFALLVPLVTAVGQLIVRASGGPVISNFDIVGFVLSPIGAVFVLVVAALTVSLMLATFSGQSWIAGHAVARRPVTVASTVAFLVRKLPKLILLSSRVFLRLVLLALPFLAVAALAWFTTLRGHDINYYLAEHPPEWRRAKLLVLVLGGMYALVAAWQLARWLYAVPILTFHGAMPQQAITTSTEMTRGRLRQIVPPLVVWWLLVTLAAVGIAWVFSPVSTAALDWAGIGVRRVLPLVALFFALSLVGGFLYSGLQLAGHQFLVTRMYAEQLDAAKWRVPATLEVSEERARSMMRPVILAAAALLALSLGAAWYLASTLDLESKVAVTAHRGAKVSAPENTMAAFRAAMEAGADFVELDVQRTSDGEIVVLHDADFMRMGGDPRKIAALTGAEVAGIDIGRKYDAAFTGEHAPPLEQVIDLARGHMKINIELKYNVPDPGLAPAVVDLLRRKDFLDQVVITSLDYGALKQVKGIEPNLKTGHIVTAAVGDVVKTEADFLSLNSARATPALIRRAHKAGKEVHVWTVNTQEVMQRMIERGVDNIITDDPVLLVKVMNERQALSRPELLGLRLRVLFGKPPQEVTDPAAVTPL
jgi:glycerophosphoryl diester phosphodiesterase